MIYRIGASELEVMLELLEDAASTGSLTVSQLERLAGDPMDLVADFRNTEIINVTVLTREHPQANGSGIQSSAKRTHG